MGWMYIGLKVELLLLARLEMFKKEKEEETSFSRNLFPDKQDLGAWTP